MRLSELIGGGVRFVRSVTRTISSISPNYDSGTGDYAYYDRARRGKVRGLEISGLLLKPLGSKIASWSFGKPPKFKAANKESTKELNDWWMQWKHKIVGAFEESLNLGDMYLVINPDLSVTVLPPNVMTLIVNPANFSEIVGWQSDIVYQHPTEPGRTQTIRNEYYADRRVQTFLTSGTEAITTTYRNFINRIPVVHIPNNAGTDELFGHTEWEALIPMLQKYGSVFTSAIEGNIRQGRPTPVISQMGSAQDVNNFWAKFGKTRKIAHADGTSETEEYLDWNGDKLLTLGSTATFDYKAPPPFTADTSTLLGLMFYLFVEHGEIPEGFLGSAIASSQASLSTQLDPLVKFIQKKQGYSEGWVLETAEIVLAFKAIINFKVLTERPTVTWQDLTNKDAATTLNAIKLGRDEHLLDRETALIQLPLDIDNVEEVLAAAQKEADEEQAKFDQGVNNRLDQAEANNARADAQSQKDQPSAQSAKNVA